MIPIFIPIYNQTESTPFKMYRYKESQIINMYLCVYALMEDGEGDAVGMGW